MLVLLPRLAQQIEPFVQSFFEQVAGGFAEELRELKTTFRAKTAHWEYLLF